MALHDAGGADRHPHPTLTSLTRSSSVALHGDAAWDEVRAAAASSRGLVDLNGQPAAGAAQHRGGCLFSSPPPPLTHPHPPPPSPHPHPHPGAVPPRRPCPSSPPRVAWPPLGQCRVDAPQPAETDGRATGRDGRAQLRVPPRDYHFFDMCDGFGCGDRYVQLALHRAGRPPAAQQWSGSPTAKCPGRRGPRPRGCLCNVSLTLANLPSTKLYAPPVAGAAHPMTLHSRLGGPSTATSPSRASGAGRRHPRVPRGHRHRAPVRQVRVRFLAARSETRRSRSSSRCLTLTLTSTLTSPHQSDTSRVELLEAAAPFPGNILSTPSCKTGAGAGWAGGLLGQAHLPGPKGHEQPERRTWLMVSVCPSSTTTSFYREMVEHVTNDTNSSATVLSRPSKVELYYDPYSAARSSSPSRGPPRRGRRSAAAATELARMPA